MIDQEKFASWWGGYFHEINSQKATALAAYLAAKQDSAAALTELKGVIERNKSLYFAMETRIEQLKADEFQATTDFLCVHADNQKLRKMLYDAAFEMVSEEFTEWHKAVENLAETPAQNIITDVTIFDKKPLQDHDAVKADAARYKYLRRLNPREFAVVYDVNIKTGEHFDTLIDRRIHGVGWR